MYPICDRKAIAKTTIQGRGTNVIDQRKYLRSEFINRLKALRLKEVDKFRNISKDNILTYETLVEIHNILLQSYEEVDSEELQELLVDVQNEIDLTNAEKSYTETQYMEETDNILKSYSCTLCDELIIESDNLLCQHCTRSVCSDF